MFGYLAGNLRMIIQINQNDSNRGLVGFEQLWEFCFSPAAELLNTECGAH